jgi:hypothetical protein
VQELLGEALDLRRHGGREEQRLAGEGDQLADALDVRDEAHVEHAVGLVDDEDLDAGEQQLAALEWSSRRPGVAISTSTPRVSLASWSSKETPPISSATFSLWLTPYLTKFSSTWAASSRVGSRMSVRGMRARARPCSSMRQHRQREGRGLAGAGLGDAEHVAAGEDVRDRLPLDGVGVV